MKVTGSDLLSWCILSCQWLPARLHKVAPAFHRCPRTHGAGGAFRVLTSLFMLLWTCWLVSVLPFSTKKEPLSSTRHIPLLCSLAEGYNSIGYSFPSQGAFISQPELGYFGVPRLECKCKTCVHASSVTGWLVPGIWDFTCVSALRGCVFFAVCWQLYSLFQVVLLSVWFAFLGQQLFMCAPWFFSPSIFEIYAYADDFVSLISI